MLARTRQLGLLRSVFVTVKVRKAQLVRVNMWVKSNFALLQDKMAKPPLPVCSLRKEYTYGNGGSAYDKFSTRTITNKDHVLGQMIVQAGDWSLNHESVTRKSLGPGRRLMFNIIRRK